MLASKYYWSQMKVELGYLLLISQLIVFTVISDCDLSLLKKKKKKILLEYYIIFE